MWARPSRSRRTREAQYRAVSVIRSRPGPAANASIRSGRVSAALANAVGLLKENPDLAEHVISVLLFPYETRGRVQQMFSDLNRFVKKTSKSLDILYDKRDHMSQIVIEVSNKVPLFHDMIDKDAVPCYAGIGLGTEGERAC